LPSGGEKIERFLSYAEELRALADRMVNPEARRIVLSVVEDYERLAAQIRAQLEGHTE
jgi:hypothetical protein